MRDKCQHCQKELNDFYIGNCKGKYFDEQSGTFRNAIFCSEECYNDYKLKYIIELFNGKPIYCVEVNGEKRYMSYFEAKYYFTNIYDCKTGRNVIFI